MVTKIFVLGRPGSGKSTIIPLIEEKIRNGRPVSDYSILSGMYLRDNGRLFEPAVPFRPDLGFNIRKPMTSPVWNIALQELEKQTLQRIRENEMLGRDELPIIEFARRDHREALDQFSPEFLAGSRFLLIEAPVPLCIDRIRSRDGQFMGEEIIRGYYGVDNYPLMKDYRGQKVERIWNEGLSLEELHKETDRVVEGWLPFFGKEAAIAQPVGLSPEQRYR